MTEVRKVIWEKAALSWKSLLTLRGGSDVYLPAPAPQSSPAPPHQEEKGPRTRREAVRGGGGGAGGTETLLVYNCASPNRRMLELEGWTGSHGTPPFCREVPGCHTDLKPGYRVAFSLVLRKPTFKRQLTEKASAAPFESFSTSCS